MIQQLWPVLLSYLTRKTFWLCALLYALLLWLHFSLPVRSQPLLWRETQVRWLPQREFDGTTAFLNWPATDEELRELRGLWIHGQIVVPGSQPGPDGKPTLSLKLDQQVGPEHLAKLEKCIQLTELHWLSVELTPEAGQSIGKLTGLRHLELSLTGSPVSSLRFLPSLPNLQVFQVPAIPPAELNLLGRHPNLRTIELNDFIPHRPLSGTLDQKPWDIWNQPATLHQAVQIEQVIIKPVSQHRRARLEGVPFREIPRDAILAAAPVSKTLCAELAKLPRLRAVEIRDPKLSWPGEIMDDRGVREALASRPDVNVNPIAHGIESVISPFGAISTVLALLMIGLQLFSHLGSSGAAVAPRFARPHLLVAGGLLTAHLTLVTSIMVINRNAAWLPALSVTTAIPAAFSILAAIAVRRPAYLPIVLSTGFVMLMFISFLVPVTLSRFTNNDFFDGRNYWIPGSILVLAFAVLAGFGQLAVRLPRQLSEAGIPLGMALIPTLQHVQLLWMKMSHQTDKAGRGFRLFDQKLEAFLARHGNCRPSQQWQAADPISRQSVLLLCALGPWLILGIYSLVYGLLSGQILTTRQFAMSSIAVGTYSLTFTVLMLAAGSQGRRQMLQQELIRPMRRSDMVREICWSAWTNAWPAAVLTFFYLAALTVMCLSGSSDSEASPLPGMLCSHALVCLTMPLMIWGGALHALSLSSQFLRGVTFVALYILLMISGGTGGLHSLAIIRSIPEMPGMPHSTSLHTTTISFATGGCCLVCGTGLILWSHRRLLRVEWGITG